jgi:PHP family Zn ribbon phosphoesterase
MEGIYTYPLFPYMQYARVACSRCKKEFDIAFKWKLDQQNYVCQTCLNGKVPIAEEVVDDY